MTLPNVTILGDSRTFDTYYVNPAYGASGYGYDRTFPFLLRKMLLTHPNPRADAIHIPDHFRGGTLDNNIIRIALTDPDIVVLLDGIWESLLTKEHFLEYVSEEVRSHSWKDGKTLDLSFSSRRVADLFVAGKLSVSPGKYALRQRRLISYFRRRRRQCVWLTLPVPPRDHFGGRHFAGDYMTIPEWGECLAAINAALVPLVERYRALILDLDQLMRDHGGAADCLVDQWHFTPRFHTVIAERLLAMIDGILAEAHLSRQHVSGRFMLPRPANDMPISLWGSQGACSAWLAANPKAPITCFAAADQSVKDAGPVILLVEEDEDRREALALELLSELNDDQIVVYADELGPLVNPTGNEGSLYGRQR